MGELLDLANQSQSDKAKEDEIVNHVRNKVEEIRASATRLSFESIWLTNTAYLLGYNGVRFDAYSRSFQPINRASAYLKKNRIYSNLILPTVQNRLARLAKNPPQYDVKPETSDTENKEAARLSLQVLNSLWEKLKINEKRLNLLMLTQQVGHSYFKVYWDPTKGNPIQDPVTGETQYEGEVAVDVVSGFEIFPNPHAKTFDEVLDTWIIQCKVRPLDYFKANYPEKGQLERRTYLVVIASIRTTHPRIKHSWSN